MQAAGVVCLELKQRALSEARSLSFAALLCYVVVSMRNKDGSHLSPLVDPLAETIGVILNDQASDEAVACAADQVTVENIHSLITVSEYRDCL